MTPGFFSGAQGPTSPVFVYTHGSKNTRKRGPIFPWWSPYHPRSDQIPRPSHGEWASRDGNRKGRVTDAG
jgi:hypothetical protein